MFELNTYGCERGAIILPSVNTINALTLGKIEIDRGCGRVWARFQCGHYSISLAPPQARQVA